MANINQPLFFTAVFLVLTGLFVLSSVSVVVSDKNYGTTYGYLIRQSFYAVLGFLAMTFFIYVPYQKLRKITIPFFLFSILLMSLVFFPKLGFWHGGAKRWINIYYFTIQPAEILKFSFIIYLASWLDTRRHHEKKAGSMFIPFIIMLGVISIFLILQPDIGTLGVIIAASVIMYFAGGGKTVQIFALAALGLVTVYFLIQSAPYRFERFKVFLDPSSDPSGSSYQINQSFIAIGSGGVLGRGFGRGIQKYSYLPEPIGDSVFALFAEEMGMAGASILVGCFVIFMILGFKTAGNSADFFGSLLAFGFTSIIASEAFINMAAISGLIPLTGIPLPFISYGGSALIMNMASVGVILNVSKSN